MSFKLFCICRALWFGNIQDLPTFLCLIYTVPLLTGHDFFMLIFLQLRNVHIIPNVHLLPVSLGIISATSNSKQPKWGKQKRDS